MMNILFVAWGYRVSSTLRQLFFLSEHKHSAVRRRVTAVVLELGVDLTIAKGLFTYPLLCHELADLTLRGSIVVADRLQAIMQS